MSGYAASAVTGADASANAKTGVSVVARTMVNAVLRLSCNAQVAVVDALIDAGCLVDVCSVEDGEYAATECECEDLDFDAECDSEDDDAVFVDVVERESAREAGPPPEDAFALERAYEIRVVRRGARYVCVPPRNPFASLRARVASNIAMGQLLGSFRGQFDAYRKLARYVETSYPDELGDIKAFLSKKPISSQIEFARAYAVDASQLSAYVRGCRLVWPNGSVPVSRIFAKL